MLSEEEERLFNQTFDLIKKELNEFIQNYCEQSSLNFDQLIEHNLLGGKLIRGKITVATVSILMENEQCDESRKEKARIIGWCIELLLAYALMVDDILDSSVTRRGQQCWYRLHPKLAPVHACILRSFLYYVLRKYCRNETNYKCIVELFLDIEQKINVGQIMDLRSSRSSRENLPPFRHFTHDYVSAIALLKTACLTTELPVRLAMYLANIDNQELHENAKRILLRIGVLFQAQDDFLDVFGDASVTGKIGTDIQEGKCCWIAVEGMSRMNSIQLQEFKKFYGVNDDAAMKAVRDIYESLNMKEIFEEFETKEKGLMLKDIEKMKQHNAKLSSVLHIIVATIAKRKL